jgi:hypothetical protein
MALSIVTFAWVSGLGSGDLWPFAVICVASGLALGADLALPAAIAADLGERQGQAGAYFGVWNFVSKLNLALAAGLALPLLTLLGYAPGSGRGLTALSVAYVLPLCSGARGRLLGAGGASWTDEAVRAARCHHFATAPAARESSITAPKRRAGPPGLPNGTLDAWESSRRSGDDEALPVVIEARWMATPARSTSASVGPTVRARVGSGAERRRMEVSVAAPTVWRSRGESGNGCAGVVLRFRDGVTYNVDFDDWMFLMDDKVMLNRSYPSKWGISLGEVTLTFVKR